MKQWVKSLAAAVAILGLFLVVGLALRPSGTAVGATPGGIQVWDIETSGSITSGNGTTDFAFPFCFLEASGVFTGAMTNNLTITLDVVLGANYDVPLQIIVQPAATNFVYRPDSEACYQKRDQLIVQWTNPSVVRANIAIRVKSP